MGYNHLKPFALNRLKLLMFICPVITVMSLGLLLWTYRPFDDRKFQDRIQYYQEIVTPTSPVQPSERQVVGIKPPEKKNLPHVLPPKQMDSFIAVNMTKTVLVSAYLEHRLYKREVRVFAVVLRSETVAYHCILWCEEQLHVSLGSSYIHTDHFGFPYGTADIMCPIPSGCRTPSHITVTKDAATAEDTLHSGFLKVKNQEEKTSFSYNFVVCFSTMFDFTNVLQLVQTLEMLQLLGVNRVAVYKTSCSPETQRILDYYTKTGLVKVIPWSMSRFLNVSRGWLPEHGPGELHYFGQIPALNDCLYRYMYRSRYVALHDPDELILPQSVNSWLELLPFLEMKYGPDKCYLFENNVFPINVMLPPPTQQTPLQQGLWKNVSGVNILSHLYHEPVKATYENMKIIVNPRSAFTTSVHTVLNSQRGCALVDRNVARMYHTRAPKQTDLTPDQLIYDGRLLNYSARLTPAVNTVLRYNGLLPDDNSD